MESLDFWQEQSVQERNIRNINRNISIERVRRLWKKAFQKMFENLLLNEAS